MSNRKLQNINLKLDFCYANNDILKEDFTCKQILHALGDLIEGPSSVGWNTLVYVVWSSGNYRRFQLMGQVFFQTS